MIDQKKKCIYNIDNLIYLDKLKARKNYDNFNDKCELVASLIHSPKILFLDKPTIGLDLIAQEKTRNFILQYDKRHNATIQQVRQRY